MRRRRLRHYLIGLKGLATPSSRPGTRDRMLKRIGEAEKEAGTDGRHVNLKVWLERMAPGLTLRTVLEKLGQIQMVDVHMPTSDGRELVMSRYTATTVEQRLLMDQMRLVMPEQPRQRSQPNNPSHPGGKCRANLRLKNPASAGVFHLRCAQLRKSG